MTFYAFDLLVYRASGNKLDFLDNFREDRSEEEKSFAYNSVFANTALIGMVMSTEIIYILTQKGFFSVLSQTASVIMIIGFVANILAMYYHAKSKANKPEFFDSLGDIVFSMLAFMILSAVAQQRIAKLAYLNLFESQSNLLRIATLIMVVIYILVLVYCYFLNIYYYIAFKFEKKNLCILRHRINVVQGRKEKNIERMISIMDEIDEEKNEQKVSIVDELVRFLNFIYVNVKLYTKQRWYSTLYLLWIGWMKVVTYFSLLLKPETIKTNKIRFLEITMVAELLSLDMILFVYLGSEDSCSRFFELLSTVVVIPILLSSLSKLKKSE